MRQKLKDTLLLITHDKRTGFFALCVVGLLIYMVINMNPPRKPKVKASESEEIKTGSTNRDENISETIDFFTKRVSSIDQKLESSAKQVDILTEKLASNEERTAEVMHQMIERIRGLESGLANAGNYQKGDGGGIPGIEPHGGLAAWGNVDDGAAVAPPAQPERKKVAFIGAGDSVRVRLLAGVNAPTDGTPYPVIFEMLSDVYGPDGSALPLGEARVMAAAQGSLTDSRALFRLTKLNFRLPDGSRKVMDIDGWVVGEDGIRGMSGALIDPIGKVMIGAAEAGFAQGYGQAIRSGSSNTQTNSFGITTSTVQDSAEYGLGTGIAATGSEWSAYIRERANLMVPHVQIKSNREATAVFSQNVNIEGLFESMSEPEAVFVSLD